MTENWTRWHTLGLVVIPVAIVLFGIVIPKERPLMLWLLILGALVLILLVAGHGKTGRFWFGWLINEQNRMSLSRVQMFLWTFIVLSAFLTAVVINFKAGRFLDAIAITLPQELLAAMGISTASLVGSPLILKDKEQRIEKKRDELTKLRGIAPDSSELKTLAPRLHQPEEARISHMVSGENEDNKDLLDLSRFQNLFFTLILVGGYAVSLGGMLITTSPISEFPAIGASTVTLLGISHVGYLAGKAR